MASAQTNGWTITLWVLAFVLTHGLISCLVLPLSGAGLGDTEAYYTAWSMAPAWGYHDHPGALAWMLAVARQLGVPGRVVPLVLSGLTLGAAMTFWRHTGGTMSGAALFAAAPIFGTGSLLIAPDAPLGLAWAVAVLTLHKGCARGAWWWWCLCGLACAAMMASKLIGGVLLLVLLAEANISARSWRARSLRSAALGFGGALGALPTLYFELSHDLSGLRYHLLERHNGAPFALEQVGTLIGGQLVVLSPVIALAICWLLWTRRGELLGESASARGMRLSVMAMVPLYLMAAFTNEAEPHWPVLAYLPMFGTLGAALEPRRLAFGASVVTGMLLQAALYVHLTTPLAVYLLSTDDYVPRYDLANDLRGWDEVGVRARAALDRGGAQRVVSYHYTVCGQLAVQVGDLSRIACLSRRRDAFDFLQGGATGSAPAGSTLLYVRDNRYDEEGSERLVCDRWGEEEVIVVERGGRLAHRFGLTVCHGFRGMK